VIVEKWRRRADERKSGGDNGRRGRAMKPIGQMIKALGDFSRPSGPFGPKIKAF
jgi:hypothetical protein